MVKILVTYHSGIHARILHSATNASLTDRKKMRDQGSTGIIYRVRFRSSGVAIRTPSSDLFPGRDPEQFVMLVERGRDFEGRLGTR
jgi:hypothetical protein